MRISFGIDEEGLTDQELEAEVRSIEGALRGLPEGSCLYQYTRVMSGFDLPNLANGSNREGLPALLAEFAKVRAKTNSGEGQQEGPT